MKGRPKRTVGSDHLYRGRTTQQAKELVEEIVPHVIAREAVSDHEGIADLLAPLSQYELMLTAKALARVFLDHVEEDFADDGAADPHAAMLAAVQASFAEEVAARAARRILAQK